MNWTLTNVQHSPHKNKKLVATFTAPDGHMKNVHFGAKGYDDYTLGASDAKRQAYWNRHVKDLKVDNPVSPAYLSYYILWGPSKNIKDNIAYYKERFNL